MRRTTPSVGRPPAAGNVISGKPNDGIFVASTGTAAAAGNLIEGN